jgi:ABC-2 type transport system permease protein
MRLVRAEWSRLFARRFTRIMILLALVILALVALGIGLSSHHPTTAQRAAAQAQADQVRADTDRQRAECERAQAGGEPTEKIPPGFDCSQINAEHVDAANFLPYQYDFRRETPMLVRVLGGVLALLGFAVGASFVGAEWSSGGMTNLLLWRPRRVPVLLAKLGTLLAGVTAAAALLGTGFLAALYGVAVWRGRLGGPTTGSLVSLGLDGLRALAVCLAASTIGFALASLGRHTAAALGVAVGWGLVAEVGLRIVLQITGVAKPERWFLSTYAAAWLNKGLKLVDYTACRNSMGECRPTNWTVTMAQSVTVAGVILAVLVVAAVASIRQRDIT